MIGASVYAEVLVHPLRTGRAEEVDQFLAEARISVVPISAEVARRAAGLRARHHGLRLPDALAVAAADAADAELLTLDQRLRRLVTHERP